MSEAAKNAVSSRRVCSYCGSVAGEHFCAECGRIQPIDEGSDYFRFMGLPRKLRIDESKLEKSFYSLSRQFHPDYFMSASASERQASMEQSAMLNDAYRTLRDKIARVTYLLTLEGYKEAEKKAPPDLLEEVFELNMQIEELKAARKIGDREEVAEARSALEDALAGLSKRLTEIDQQVFALFGDWDSAVDRNASVEDGKPLLDRMSELLSHRSYIRHLVGGLKEELG